VQIDPELHRIAQGRLRGNHYAWRMSRPLRIEFPEAIYHVTSRGNRKDAIFLDDRDRHQWLDVLEQVAHRFDVRVLAYCLMGNHFHIVLQTRRANLSTLMRHLNGVYSQMFNRRHQTTGHLFQGRFHSSLVDRDEYLLTLCAYVELNPVRAGLVKTAAAWRWSSYRANTGAVEAPAWLAVNIVHDIVLGRDVRDVRIRRRAWAAYESLVQDAHASASGGVKPRQQIFIGDECFVERMQARATRERLAAHEIPSVQRRLPKTAKASLAHWLPRCCHREEAVCNAHCRDGISIVEIARQLGLSSSWVGRLVRRGERQMASRKAD
jgi:putative transposase